MLLELRNNMIDDKSYRKKVLSENFGQKYIALREEIFAGWKFSGFCGFDRSSQNCVPATFNKLKYPQN